MTVTDLLLRPVACLDVDAQLGLDALLVVDLLDADEGVVGRRLGRGTGHDDLLDQPQLEGAHRIEPVDQVVRVAVRGRVAQRAERIQRLDRLLRLVGGIHALRLVDDDDGPRRLHELDRLAAGELVALLVDDVALLLRLGAGEVLAERVDVDDQDLQRVAGRELAQPVDPLRVVDEVLERQVVVERAEVLGGDLDVLQHAFADGHARHHDDELLEAVAPRQLEDGAQIDVGLARAGLHLHREVRAEARPDWPGRRTAPTLPARRRGRPPRCRCGAGARAGCRAACPQPGAADCRRPVRCGPARRTVATLRSVE